LADGADDVAQSTCGRGARAAPIPRSGDWLVDNVVVERRRAAGRLLVLPATMLLATLLPAAACSSGPPGPDPTPTVIGPQADRDHLAGLAAAAQGRAYVATYQLTATGHIDRTITVAIGSDGSWLVAIPATVLSGLADVAIFHSAASGNKAAADYQCLLGPAAGTAGVRPDLGPLSPGCIRFTALTSATDPRVQHVFTDWLVALTDRATALSVTARPAPEGVAGACFAVESTSAALSPPVDPGWYCFTPDGQLTAASVGFGTLRLTGPVASAPPSVAMPGPVVARGLVPMVAPSPPPSPTPSPSATPHA
jgi:hypothetical protein